MISWTDSHCHLDSIDSPVDEVIDRAGQAGVATIITLGTNVATSRRAVEIAEQHPDVWAGIGVHPHDASTWDLEALSELDRLAGSPKVVAVGEIGLDFYRDFSPRDDQRRALVDQLDLAKRLGAAAVIHVREAFPELFAILGEVGPPDRLIFHCFSGSPKEARTVVELGGFVSFAGNVSFPKAQGLRDAAREVPLERILVETDSPYLAPVPHRGKPNEPALVPFVGKALADLLNLDVEELAAASHRNAREVFGISNRAS